jgi:hypothetical protein
MKSLMSLSVSVLRNMGSWFGISTTNDEKTLVSRFNHEGLSFLTIALPDFAADLQKGLERGKVDHSLFQGFTWRAGLPLFLGGFLDLVIDRGTGKVLDNPSTDAIFAIRQICLFHGKVSLPCSNARQRKAVDRFIQCEEVVRQFDVTRDSLMLSEFSRMSLLLFGDIFQRVDEDIYYGRMKPKHGPGATADRLRGNMKFIQTEWTERLEPVFPFGEYLAPNWRYFQDLTVDLLEPGMERPVRVVLVPKTLKTPRVIAVEPTCMQYVQQAIKRSLLDSLERDDILSKIILFDDQEPNQRLARVGSVFGTHATLDLSDASDRVSNQLVRELVRHFPYLANGLDATRSRKADVKDNGVIRLSKYASMGSALCFPIEAMVFTTIVLLGIQDVLTRPMTKRDVASLMGQVLVYGDDIIVPVETVHSVIRRLEAFGLAVNADKSFWTGKFRESCGKEYYDGTDVSVVRCRSMLPTSRRHAQEIISTASLRNRCYYAGLWEVARELDDILGRLIPFPTVLPTSPILGRHSFLGYTAEGQCSKLHVPIVKGAVISVDIPPSHLAGVGALLKFFLKDGDLPNPDERHLERAGRPDIVRIKIRRASSI